MVSHESESKVYICPSRSQIAHARLATAYSTHTANLRCMSVIFRHILADGTCRCSV